MPERNADIILWRKLKNGDSSAFETIYNNEINDLINYGRRYTQNLELIEDCVHDLFVYVWNKRSNLSDTDSIKKYLIVSLRNRILNTLKKNSKTEFVAPEENSFETDDSIEQNIIKLESSRELAFKLEHSFDILSSRQKEAIFLRYYSEMSYENICEVMNINNQSARNLISSGLKKLNTELKNKK